METLLRVLNEITNLETDKDLFAYEIPLDTSGVWLSDAQRDSRFNDSHAEEFEIYYRGKDKVQSIANIKYLFDTINAMSGSTGACELEDGTEFNLKQMFTWDYLEKDAEGYFVWTSRLRLLI